MGPDEPAVTGSGGEPAEAADPEAQLACQRRLFSIPSDIHYLNCAFLAPLPRAAEAAGIAAIRERRAPVGFPAERFFEESDALKRLFAGLIGATDPERVALQPSVSYGISVAARNVGAAPGSNVVLLEGQFPSNVYPWRRMAGERGARIRTVPRPGAAAGEPVGLRWTDRAIASIDPSTAVVALPQVHWTDGSLLDLEAIGSRAREVGAALVVDATQSVGAHPFDVERIRPDAVACAAYKWLLGPYGLSFAWYGPRFDGGRPLEETWAGREGSEDFQALVRYRDAYRPAAARYDAGERSSFVHVAMATASLDLVGSWRPRRIQAYCRTLLAEALGALRERGFEVPPEAGRAAHLVGVRLPEGAELAGLSRRLLRRGVHASLRGDALRLSPNVYNDPHDAEALVEAVGSAP